MATVRVLPLEEDSSPRHLRYALQQLAKGFCLYVDHDERWAQWRHAWRTSIGCDYAVARRITRDAELDATELREKGAPKPPEGGRHRSFAKPWPAPCATSKPSPPPEPLEVTIMPEPQVDSALPNDGSACEKLTMTEASERFGVNVKTVSNWARRGEINFSDGGTYRGRPRKLVHVDDAWHARLARYVPAEEEVPLRGKVDDFPPEIPGEALVAPLAPSISGDGLPGGEPARADSKPEADLYGLIVERAAELLLERDRASVEQRAAEMLLERAGF